MAVKGHCEWRGFWHGIRRRPVQTVVSELIDDATGRAPVTPILQTVVVLDVCQLCMGQVLANSIDVESASGLLRGRTKGSAGLHTRWRVRP